MPAVVTKESGTALQNGLSSRVAPFRIERPSGLVEIIPALDFESVTPSTRLVTFEELYQEDVGRAELLRRARTLLAGGLERIKRARRHLSADEVLDADFEVTLFQGEVPELFCLRTLSDGYAAIIVSLHHALRGRSSSPLTDEQMFAIQECLARKKSEIFLDYQAALDLIDGLEAAGLTTNPPEAASLSALLLDESGS